MNTTSLLRKGGIAVAAALLFSLPLQATFNPVLAKNLIKPLQEEYEKQIAIWAEADDIAKTYDVFVDKFQLGQTGINNSPNLKANRDELQKKAEKFKGLIDAKYVSLEAFAKPITIPGESYLVIGVHDMKQPGVIQLRNENNSSIVADLVDYWKPDIVTSHGFVAYGIKDPVREKTLKSEKGYYYAFGLNEYNEVANTYNNQSEDVAGWFYFSKVIPAQGFMEDFSRLDRNIAIYISDLDKVVNHDGLSFYEYRTGKVARKCPDCGATFVNGACPNGPHVKPQPKCPDCGAALVNGACPNGPHGIQPPPPPPPQPEKPDYTKYLPWAVVALLAIVAIVIIALRKGPTQPPTPPPPARCQRCGSPLVNGRCPNCDQPQPPMPTKACPRCGATLVNGECPECTKVPEGPASFHNFDEEATRVPAHFDLEILSPAKFAGKFLDRLPAKFEMGRRSETKKPPEGVPFCALNLKGDPDAGSCSRRYIRFSMTEAKDGFNVDLLADNDCKVGGTTLRKGENAVAKPGDVISISPNWSFKVVPRK